MTCKLSDGQWDAALAGLEQVPLTKRGNFLARYIEKLVYGNVPDDDREAADRIVNELLTSKEYLDVPYMPNKIA
jgi:hypothetical protein